MEVKFFMERVSKIFTAVEVRRPLMRWRPRRMVWSSMTVVSTREVVTDMGRMRRPWCFASWRRVLTE